MKEIMAIVRINMMNKTKAALAEAGISSVTARDALGRGKGLVDLNLLEGAEKGYEEAIVQLGQSQRLIPKRIFFVVVPDRLVKKTVQTIMSSEPHRQIGRRQDLRHARDGLGSGADRRVRRSGPGRSLKRRCRFWVLGQSRVGCALRTKIAESRCSLNGAQCAPYV